MITETVATLPNALSAARALLGFGVAALIIAATPSAHGLALILMCVAGLTDILDGVLARRSGRDSELGSYLDPACDGIYHFSVYAGLMVIGIVPVWMLAVLYGRELLIPYLRSFSKQRGTDLGVRSSIGFSALVHTLAQIVLVGLAGVAFTLPFPATQDAISAVLYLALAASVYAVGDHIGALISAKSP